MGGDVIRVNMEATYNAVRQLFEYIQVAVLWSDVLVTLKYACDRVQL